MGRGGLSCDADSGRSFWQTLWWGSLLLYSDFCLWYRCLLIFDSGVCHFISREGQIGQRRQRTILTDLYPNRVGAIDGRLGPYLAANWIWGR